MLELRAAEAQGSAVQQAALVQAKDRELEVVSGVILRLCVFLWCMCLYESARVCACVGLFACVPACM